MSACSRCGSRSVRLVVNLWTWPVHVIGDLVRTKCPRCGWRGWQHKNQWLHIPHAGVLAGGTGHTNRHPTSESSDRSHHRERHHHARHHTPGHHHRHRHRRRTWRWDRWLLAGMVLLAVALFWKPACSVLG